MFARILVLLFFGVIISILFLKVVAPLVKWWYSFCLKSLDSLTSNSPQIVDKKAQELLDLKRQRASLEAQVGMAKKKTILDKKIAKLAKQLESNEDDKDDKDDKNDGEE